MSAHEAIVASLERARQIVRVREEIAVLLVGLSAEERTVVLAELLVLHERASSRPSPDPVMSAFARASPAQKSTFEPRPEKSLEGAILQAKLLEFMAAHPGASVREMAASVYGADTRENDNKIRVLLGKLQGKRLVANVGRGRWGLVGGEPSPPTQDAPGTTGGPAPTRTPTPGHKRALGPPPAVDYVRGEDGELRKVREGDAPLPAPSRRLTSGATVAEALAGVTAAEVGARDPSEPPGGPTEVEEQTPRCGHSACRESWVDTGDPRCFAVEGDDPEEEEAPPPAPVVYEPGKPLPKEATTPGRAKCFDCRHWWRPAEGENPRSTPCPSCRARGKPVRVLSAGGPTGKERYRMGATMSEEFRSRDLLCVDCFRKTGARDRGTTRSPDGQGECTGCRARVAVRYFYQRPKGGT